LLRPPAMRYALAALMLFSTGCFIEEPPPPRTPSSHEHYSLPPPRAPRVEMSQNDFDSAAARRALHAVEYRDCGQGGAGRIVLVFNPSGNVIRASVADARYTEGVERCVLARFQVVHVPPFLSEEEHAVGFRIFVPQPYEAPPTIDPDQEEREDANPVPTSM